MPDRVTDAKKTLYDGLYSLCSGGPDRADSVADSLFAEGMQLRAFHPVNEVSGRAQSLAALWRPMLTSFPDAERRDEIVVGGAVEDRTYVATLGHYCGTFTRDWLGIPASRELCFLRYGEIYEVREGRVVQANCLWDVLDLMRQAGCWPIAPSLGAEVRWPGPLTSDGVRLANADPAVSAASLAQTLAMHATLGAYNDLAGLGREGLLEMPQREHWHPRMMWYGPAGIGTTRGLAGFVDNHQLPFRRAFPMRKGGGQWDSIADIKEKTGGGHYVRIGDGPYSVTSGWPSVFAVHSGDGFLGLGPTGRSVTMRVMDFYLHHEGLIRENWVPLDVSHLLLQMGVDVFERLPARVRSRN